MAAEQDRRVERAIIVACSENGVIGVDGDLPWTLPDDLKHFMTSTRGHAVVMGRKTYESLPGVLKGRELVVLTRGSIEGVRCASSYEEGMEMAGALSEGLGTSTVWIAGGERVYRRAIEDADVVVLTRVHVEVAGDTRFPAFPREGWVLEGSEVHAADARHAHAFTIERWRRRGS